MSIIASLKQVIPRRSHPAQPGETFDAPIASRRSHPAKHGEDRFGPPTLERSGSEHRRTVTSLALLERARAWEWVKDPLFARGGQGSRSNTIINKKLTL